MLLACLHDSQKSTIRYESASKIGYAWWSGMTAMVGGWTKGRAEPWSYIRAWYASQIRCPETKYGTCASYISRYT